MPDILPFRWLRQEAAPDWADRREPALLDSDQPSDVGFEDYDLSPWDRWWTTRGEAKPSEASRPEIAVAGEPPPEAQDGVDGYALSKRLRYLDSVDGFDGRLSVA